MREVKVKVRERTKSERNSSGRLAMNLVEIRGVTDTVVGRIYANLRGDVLDIDYAHVVEEMRGRGFYRSALAKLMETFTVRSDSQLSAPAQKAYEALGAVRQPDGRFVLEKKAPTVEVAPAPKERLAKQWLDDDLAPNGVPVKDNFANWFRKSKVVEKDGSPKMVFHGTTADIAAFDITAGNNKTYTGATENAAFFTDNPHNASGYAGRRTSMTGLSATYQEGANVVPVYLSIQRALRVSAKGEAWNYITHKGESYSTPELVDMAQRAGYDGLIVTRIVDSRDAGVTAEEHLAKKPSTTYVVFNPGQIKSAVGNSGLYLRDSSSLTDHEDLPALKNAMRAQADLFDLLAQDKQTRHRAAAIA